MKATYRLSAAISAALVFVAVLGAQEPPEALEIRSDDGTTFGRLRFSEADGTLALVDNRGASVVIGECEDAIVLRARGPSEYLAAHVYHRNCGATVDFATHVSIVAGDKKAVVAVYRGRPRVEVKWLSRTALEIRHSALDPENVFTRASIGLGVSVSYVATEEVVEPTDQYVLDFANVNYGAAGLRAGMPRELILRWAGWSQEASGMHRQEWNRWFTTPTYGDDPHGHEKIREGFRVYESYKSTEP